MKSLFDAISKAQAEFPNIPKTKEVKKKGMSKAGKSFEYSYWYADWEIIIEKTKPILAKHGLSFGQEIINNECLTHVQHVSGEERTFRCPVLIPNTNMQELGAAFTYAKRYCFSLAFGISTDDDQDANELMNEPYDLRDKTITLQKPNTAQLVPSSTAAEVFLPPHGNNKSLTQPQIKRAYAIGHSNKWPPAMCDALSNKLFQKNISQLNKKQYDDLCTALGNECTQFQKDELKNFVRAPNFAAKVQEEVKKNYVDHTAAPQTSYEEELPY